MPADYSDIEIIPLDYTKTSDKYPSALDPETTKLEESLKHVLDLRSPQVTINLEHRRLFQVEVPKGREWGGRKVLFFAYKCSEPCTGSKGDWPENQYFKKGSVYGDVIILLVSNRERVDRNGKASYHNMSRRIVNDVRMAGVQQHIMNQIANF